MGADQGKENHFFALLKIEGPHISAYVHTPIAGKFAFQWVDSKLRVSGISYEKTQTFIELFLKPLGQFPVLLLKYRQILDRH